MRGTRPRTKTIITITTIIIKYSMVLVGGSLPLRGYFFVETCWSHDSTKKYAATPSAGTPRNAPLLPWCLTMIRRVGLTGSGIIPPCAVR